MLASGFGYSLYYANTFNCRNLSHPNCSLSCDQDQKNPKFAGQLAVPGRAWCEMVKRYPNIPIEISISRMSASTSHQVGTLGYNTQGNQSLPAACYLQNHKGQFIGYDGARVNY